MMLTNRLLRMGIAVAGIGAIASLLPNSGSVALADNPTCGTGTNPVLKLVNGGCTSAPSSAYLQSRGTEALYRACLDADGTGPSAYANNRSDWNLNSAVDFQFKTGVGGSTDGTFNSSSDIDNATYLTVLAPITAGKIVTIQAQSRSNPTLIASATITSK